jgi:hypothetical protein
MPDEPPDDIKTPAGGQAVSQSQSNDLLKQVAAAIKKLRGPAAALVKHSALHLTECVPHKDGSPTSEILLQARKDREQLGAAATHSKVQAVRTAALRLQGALAALPAPARATLKVSRLEHELKTLIGAELPDKARPGAKKNTDDLEYFMEELWKIFLVHTGKKPARTVEKDGKKSVERGDFLDFVTELFGIFDIKASPVSQARAAIKRMEEITPNNRQ